jgi:hypothetical protein
MIAFLLKKLDKVGCKVALKWSVHLMMTSSTVVVRNLGIAIDDQAHAFAIEDIVESRAKCVIPIIIA